MSPRLHYLAPALALALTTPCFAEKSALGIVNGVPVMQANGERLSPLVFSGGAFSLGRPFLATGQWSKVTYSEVAAINDPQAMVQINLGSATGRVQLRNFELIRERDGEKDIIENQPFAASALPQGWNFIVAPKAEASVAFGPEGVSLDVSKRTDFAWDVQLARTKVALERGARYTISFEVRTDAAEWPLTSYLMKSEPLRFYAGHDSENQFLTTTRMATANGVDVVAMLIPQMPWTASPQEQAEEMDLIHASIEEFAKEFPETKLILRFGVEPSRTWKRNHASELLAFEDGKTSRYICVTSEAWLTELRRRVPAFVSEMEQRWGTRIVGYAPAAQSTGEWYYPIWEGAGFPAMNFSNSFLRAYRKWLEKKHGSVDVLNARWGTAHEAFQKIRIPTKEERAVSELGPFRNPATQQALLDFTEFQQVAMLNAIETVASSIKSASAKQKLVILFYGYTFELAGAQNGIGETGHLLLGELLKSPSVDGIIDLISYGDRGFSGTGMLMTPIESITASGKLPFTEDDSRTHRSAANAGYERTTNVQETNWAQMRNFLRSIVHNGIQWKFDLYGQGWFAEEKTWQELGSLAKLARADAPQPYRSDIAVIVDERSFLALRPGVDLTKPLISENRRALSRTGMGDPSWWLLSDLVAGRVPPRKLTIILNAFWLSKTERAALLKQCRSGGGTVLWLYAPGFLDEEGASFSGMKELTGFEYRSVDIKGSGQHLSSPTGVLKDLAARDLPFLAPGVDYYLTVDGNGVEPLATFPGSPEIAIAAKDHEGFRSIYCAAPGLTPAMVARLALESGVEAIAPVGTIVLNNARFLGVTSPQGGTIPISLPNVNDVLKLDGTVVQEAAQKFETTLQPGETQIFQLRPSSVTPTPQP